MLFVCSEKVFFFPLPNTVFFFLQGTHTCFQSRGCYMEKSGHHICGQHDADWHAGMSLQGCKALGKGQ